MILRRAFLAAVLLLPGGCGDAAPPPAPVPPPAPKTPVPALPKPPAVRFADLHRDATGFGPVNHTGIPNDKQWIAEAMGGGIVVLDHDGDGDMDLLAVDGNVVGRDPLPDARTRLYRNDGAWKFTEVTKEAGIDITGVGYGGAAADYDGDGDTDVFVGMLGPSHLLRNEGNGTFTDVAAAAGVRGDPRDMTTGGCWSDLDGDGRLDLYVSTYVDMLGVLEQFRKEGRAGRSCDWRGFKVYCGPMGLPYQADRLYLQREDGTFTEASDRLRGQRPEPSFQAMAADFDGDGDQDVFVANDTEANHLWVNDGKGNFTDQAYEAGCAVSALVTKQACMGVDVADYDHDGQLDIVVTNFSQDYNTVYRNTSIARKAGGRQASFQDVSVRTGVSQPTFQPLSWAACFLDFDLDGDRDLFFSTGHVYGEIDRFADTGNTYRQRNLLLENGGGTSPLFRDVSAEAGPGLRVMEVHRDGQMADLDDDGDEDLALSVLNGEAYLLRNDGGNANAWIRISLRGGKPRDPAGATVRVEAGGLLPQTALARRGSSFLGSMDPRLIFGLGAAAKASRVVVTWPSGKRDEFRDLAARKHWLLEEGAAAAKEIR